MTEEELSEIDIFADELPSHEDCPCAMCKAGNHLTDLVAEVRRLRSELETAARLLRNEEKPETP